MSYYDTFVNIARAPKEQYLSDLQQIVYEEFENASSVDTIEEEVAMGTLEFKPITVRINTIVDAKTGQRVNDDYKKLIFEDIEYKPLLGTRYRFDNNIWIVYSTDNKKRPTSNVYVRRCNATLNIQDKYGVIHKEPCYISYTVTETQPFRETHIDVGNGRIWVQIQNNETTKDINVNHRFMFGKNSYKIREFHDFDRHETFVQQSSVASFYADFDGVAPDDNKELEVANYFECPYVISVPNNIDATLGVVGKLEFDVDYMGNKVDEDMIFESLNEGVLSIDDLGNYYAHSVGECEVLVKLKNNTTQFKTVLFNVSDIPADKYSVVLEPNVYSIKLNKYQTYSINEYFNNEIIDTKFEIECLGISSNYYDFKTDGNNFSILNLKTNNDTSLKVVCKNLRTFGTPEYEEISFEVRLGGMF